VWVTVRVNGHLYDVAASKPEHWGLPFWGGVEHGMGGLGDQHARRAAVDLVTSWAQANTAELAVLFDQAGRKPLRWFSRGTSRAS
jgi:hypothetical protein